MWGFFVCLFNFYFFKIKRKVYFEKILFFKRKKKWGNLFFKIFDRLAIIMKIFNGKQQCFNKFLIKKKVTSPSVSIERVAPDVFTFQNIRKIKGLYRAWFGWTGPLSQHLSPNKKKSLNSFTIAKHTSCTSDCIQR